eukprot:TRINITY_DN638_c0_g1_i1.p1 TRINITY_DN638_c0_g1~~TRINITY_DN638_c0_g1_i1.p1  ORF type:complete len:227 (+),score=71.19 TRINITY_DN638_c0_g1_i1:44-724(+)
MSKGTAKHEVGFTLGSKPEVFPFLLSHCGERPGQRALREKIVREERSMMMGSPDEAQFLGWLLGLVGAKKVIEVGVFRGSTTLAMAQQLPEDGKVVGLDVSADYAKLGIEAWKACGVDHKIDLRIAPAVESLAAMVADHAEVNTYDLAFIDADKVNYSVYYEHCVQLVRPGGIIAVDNTLWSGRVVAPETEDDHAIVNVCEQIKQDTRVHAVMLGIADGLYLCRKL